MSTVLQGFPTLTGVNKNHPLSALWRLFSLLLFSGFLPSGFHMCSGEFLAKIPREPLCYALECFLCLQPSSLQHSLPQILDTLVSPNFGLFSQPRV